jgi:hypothetical protein
MFKSKGSKLQDKQSAGHKDAENDLMLILWKHQ